MLKQLFTSNTRVKLLSLFLLNPENEYFIRELTRKLDEQINSVRRELDNLKKLGLLKTKVKNRKKYYIVNKKFVVFNELRNIVVKALSEKESIVKRLTEFGEMDLIVLSGIFIDKETPIDLLIVGKIDRKRMEDFFTNEIETKRPVRFSIMSKEEYQYRSKCNDKFIKDIMNDNDNIVALNRID
jgi:predicted transcriptional regulator